MAAVQSEGLRFGELGGLLDCLGFALDTRERVQEQDVIGVYLLEASLVGLSVLRAEQTQGRERKRRVTAWFVRLRLACTSTALSFMPSAPSFGSS